MSFGSILYSIIVLPIESIIEFVFCFVLDKFDKFGVAGAIVAVSLAVNFLALPIYNVADEIQLKEREIQKRLAYRIKRIKQAFKGDEQFMMLNTYYRENNYHPLYTLRQSLSILIEIPFFIAAYHFLSHCSLLQNQSILFLKDLSKPDGLIPISLMGGGINLLPILMTAINIVSSMIYTKGAPLREKIQTFALAGIFLVLLYNSPSGLVFYWVLNQIFSLCKNIIKKLPRPGRIVYGFFCLFFIAASLYFAIYRSDISIKKKIVVYGTSFSFILAPIVLKILNSKLKKTCLKSLFENNSTLQKQNFALFFVSCVSLWLLCGLYLPSNIIATSPAEFSFLGGAESPMFYIYSSLLYFCGLFLFWPFVIFKMFSSNEKVKKIMPTIFFVLALCALANVFFFKYNYGTLSIYFRLDNSKVLENYSVFFLLGPLCFLAIAILIKFILTKFKLNIVLLAIIFSICTAQSFVSIKNCIKVKTEFNSLVNKNISKPQNSGNAMMYNLSRTQPNVFVLFLDRAISCFFPYVLEQFPELKKSFDGFTYFPNTLSFGDFTNTGVPAMCGGYDYTIDAINARSDVLLKDKHNEALKLLPTIFNQAGYDASIFELPYEDYESGKNIWEGTDIKKLYFPEKLEDKFYIDNPDLNLMENKQTDKIVTARARGFSILQIIYPPLRKLFYARSTYYQDNAISKEIEEDFLEEYIELYYLPEITSFSSEKPTFHYIGNTITHEYTTLREGYVPGIIDETHPVAGTGVYKILQENDGSSENDFMGYHVNAAALLQVAKWLDYLKENGVYDNMRIIIVADHGRGIKLPCFENFTNWGDAGFFNPLLLMKDFNSRGEYKTDMKLHTNADVPYFATKDLGVSKTNPFTGNTIKQSTDFDSFNVYRIVNFRPANDIKKTQFSLKGKTGYNVSGNIFDESKWKKFDASNNVD